MEYIPSRSLTRVTARHNSPKGSPSSFLPASWNDLRLRRIWPNPVGHTSTDQVDLRSLSLVIPAVPTIWGLQLKDCAVAPCSDSIRSAKIRYLPMGDQLARYYMHINVKRTWSLSLSLSLSLSKHRRLEPSNPQVEPSPTHQNWENTTGQFGVSIGLSSLTLDAGSDRQKILHCMQIARGRCIAVCKANAGGISPQLRLGARAVSVSLHWRSQKLVGFSTGKQKLPMERETCCSSPEMGLWFGPA